MTKIILVLSESNLPWENELFKGMVLKVETVSQYLVGLLGDIMAHTECLDDNAQGW